MTTEERPYLETTVAEVQERLHSAGFAHEHALSVALKLSSLSYCQVAAKGKVTNLDKPVPDQLSLKHKLGKWTLQEDIKSSSKFKLTATYSFSDKTNATIEADFPKRAVKGNFVHASSWSKCEATASSEGGFQVVGTLGNEKLGGNVDLKVKDKGATYTFAIYAKQPKFDLMLRCVKSPTTASLNLSYFQQFNPNLSFFALAQYDASAGSKSADVTCTYAYDSSNSAKLQLGTTGEICCSLVHAISEKVGLAYGMQTTLSDLMHGNTSAKYGMKLKLGLDKS